jgi:hypothetical protein
MSASGGAPAGTGRIADIIVCPYLAEQKDGCRYSDRSTAQAAAEREEGFVKAARYLNTLV